MNLLVPDVYDEQVERLALGLEPIDALRGARVASVLDVRRDGVPPPLPRWRRIMLGLPPDDDLLLRIRRHSSCLHVLLVSQGVTAPVDLRFRDPSRRLVPRRIRYELPPVADTRVRRPAFFPGAAYDLSETATALRGRVTWRTAEDTLARWVRVEARLNGDVVGHAHGDDRGEFLLLIDSTAGGLGPLPTGPARDLRVEIKVEVFGHQPAGAPAPRPPVPPRPALPREDPLWDLPLETAPAIGPDHVSSGATVPAGYRMPGEALPAAYASTPLSTRTVTFRLGRIRTDEPMFSFMP